MVGTGSVRSKSLILKELFVYFSLKQGLYRFFRGQKERYRKKKRMAKDTESHNALSDAGKCDTGPENAYNWIGFTDFQLVGVARPIHK